MATLTNRLATRALVGLVPGLAIAWLAIVRAAEPAWSTAAPMGQPRAVMTATPLLDGRVLVAGGVDPAATMALSSAEVFDPASNSWSAAGTLSEARYYPPMPPRSTTRRPTAGPLSRRCRSRVMDTSRFRSRAHVPLSRAA